MSWNVMRERGGKAEKLVKKVCKIKELAEDLCDEFEDMEDYFGERDDDRYDREEMMERRHRSRY